MHGDPSAGAIADDNSKMLAATARRAGGQLGHRAIQVSLSGEAVARYADEWIISISDITDCVQQAEPRIRARAAVAELPVERIYPIDGELARRIGASP